jgi:GxxExxY protein
MVELIFKEESYQIMGCCFEVFNNLGPGLRESSYQKALEKVFETKDIRFKSQQYVPNKIDQKVVGRNYLDFLINDKIAIEIKAGDHFFRKDIDQLYSYLKSSNLQLGLLINFTKDGVLSKRILNIK